ncbi:MAG: DUF6036 family nucleotidyltransferase [Calditrichia bacterium]
MLSEAWRSHYLVAQELQVFLFVHKHSKIDIDISIGILPFEQNCIEKAIEVKAGGISILLPTPEDLIIMKAIAHRSRDLIDIESILDANPVLDYTYIRQSLKEFSTLLEMPEILQDFELIFNKSQKGKK